MTSDLNRPMLYQNIYTWLLLAASMDIIMTWVVLWFGGHEVNPVADVVLKRHGLPGFVAYKFALVVLFIVICEVVGRTNRATGRRLAGFAVALTAVPIAWSFALLLISPPRT
jgi:hypothetical protein